MPAFVNALAKAALSGAAAMSMVGAVPALAATFVSLNNDASFSFGGTEAGTSATLYLQLTEWDTTSNRFTFTYELENKSDIIINPTSRLRSFGFDDFNGAVDVTSVARGATATNPFGFDSTAVDASFPTGPAVYDVCIHDGSNGNCNGGNAGLTVGNVATGTFFLDYAGSGMTSLTLDNFIVRYQSLGLNGQGSGTGMGEEIPGQSGGPVPEPSTWAMMLLGFGATGFAMRRRRAVASQVKYSFA